jgi:hypothetical protein
VGKLHPEIDSTTADFIRAQRLFFVGTAPAGSTGRVNVSPKGLDTFRILDPRTVAYLDLTGSGIETVAHLRDNGRITFLFCSLENAPRILRLYGRGEAIEPGDPEFESLEAGFPRYDGTRTIIRVSVERIADSCGYGVPMFRYEGERPQLCQWAERKGPRGLARYRADNNRKSVDCLPGLRRTGSTVVDDH